MRAVLTHAKLPLPIARYRLPRFHATLKYTPLRVPVYTILLRAEKEQEYTPV